MVRKTGNKVIVLCVLVIGLLTLLPNVIAHAANEPAPIQQMVGVNLL